MNNIENAYLYSMWNGRLVLYRGTVWPATSRGWSSFKSSKKRHQCSQTPGTLYNGVVWFEQRNDEEAKNVLIDYEKRMIRNCDFKIIHHQEKIRILSELPIIEY